MTTSNLVLAPQRDIRIFHYLWDWKVVTTTLLAARFFPGVSVHRAYCRLNDLCNAGYIESRYEAKANSRVWGLNEKGFALIKPDLGVLTKQSFRSECIWHDLIASAFHQGELCTVLDPPLKFFTEQHLRSIDPEFYPSWAPKTTLHRPDGYWRAMVNGERKTIALEVELHSKRLVDYTGLANFYGREDGIHHVLWLVPQAGFANRIYGAILKSHRGSEKNHSFALLPDFEKQIWNAPIAVGYATGSKIRDCLGLTTRSRPEVPLADLLFNFRKYPVKSRKSELLEFRKNVNCIRPTVVSVQGVHSEL